MKRCVAIERVAPRPGGAEVPALSRRGYELACPRHGAERHHARHAVFVRTLDEAASLVERGYSIRMGRPGLRPSLISPGKLRVTWA